MSASEKLTSKIMDVMDEFKDGTQYVDSTRTSITSKYTDEIVKYIKDNTKITVSYTGVITETGLPDPVVMDIVDPKITNNYSRYAGTSFKEWIEHILTNVYNNVFVSKGLYLDEPLLTTKLFNKVTLDLLLENPATIEGIFTKVNKAFNDDCDDNGRLRIDKDVAYDCQKVVITELLNILISLTNVTYMTNNLTSTSSGSCTVNIISIT